ncbi:MAG: ROK family protein [Chryseolinea sp.]
MTDPKKELPQSKILTIDIGGSTIKGTVLDQDGKIIQDYKKLQTPDRPTPERVLETIQKLVKDFQNYDHVSVGFPGYIKNGIVITAPNLINDAWRNTNLNKLIGDALQKPVRTVNDADLQGLGVVSGEGLEMVITLGTGFGTALLLDGNLLPHLELAHHAITKDYTYDDYVGDEALESKGPEKWNKRVRKVLTMLKTVFNYDRLYIGGGNSNKLTFKLDENMIIITNKDGIRGGARLWQLDEKLFIKSSTPLSQ